MLRDYRPEGIGIGGRGGEIQLFGPILGLGCVVGGYYEGIVAGWRVDGYAGWVDAVPFGN